MSKETAKLSLMNEEERSIYLARKMNQDKNIIINGAFLKGEKGDKGDTPIKGEDYFTDADIETVKNNIREDVTPKKGVHYFDGKDGKNGKDGRNGRDGRDGIDGEKGKKGDSGESPEIKDIIKELKKKQYLEPKDIKGMPLNMNDMRWHGGGLSTISHDATMTGNGTPSNPLSVVATSLGSIISAIDSGNHQDYNLAQSPTTSNYYSIINNGIYTTDDTAFGFSVVGTVLIFNSPLPSDIAGSIIKLVCI